MKFKLRKADKNKQATIRQTIQRGLPLASLLASAAFSAGCGESKTRTIAGTPAPPPESRQYIDGDVIPASTEPNPEAIRIRKVVGMLPARPQEVQLPEKTEIYIVKSGDTLHRIAKNNGASVDILKALNNFTGEQANKLTVGQEIIVPQKDNRSSEKDTPLPMLGAPPPREPK